MSTSSTLFPNLDFGFARVCFHAKHCTHSAQVGGEVQMGKCIHIYYYAKGAVELSG